MIEAFAIGKSDDAAAVLVLAPRHPQRCGDVAGVVQRAGFAPVLLSEWRSHSEPLASGSVLLVDTVGELAGLYSLAAGAFVGGSLIARGGHNPLEPAQFGVPVAMGPHYENFRPMVDAMRAQAAITIVADGELAIWISDCLAAEPELVASGERGRAFFESQRGATERTLQKLLPLVRNVAGRSEA